MTLTAACYGKIFVLEDSVSSHLSTTNVNL